MRVLFCWEYPKKVVFVFTWHWNVRLTFVNHETLLKLTSLITFLPLAFLCFYWLLKRHFLKVYSVNWKIHYTKTCCLKASLISSIAIIYRSRGVFRTLYILFVDPNPFSQQIEQSIKQIFFFFKFFFLYHNLQFLFFFKKVTIEKTITWIKY